jgi:FAD/FMN-containing dehydrogenase
MSLVGIATSTPVPHANARLVDVAGLERALGAQLDGEVRFDAVSRALYSTDASVYQMVPLGVAVAKTREDLIRIVRLATEFRCPITVRGGGTAQAGQSIGDGLQVDTSKYFNQILELNVEERWARVQPGIVLDELNAALKPHGLRFAPDVSTASRACVGGMMANNSSGARSFLYGKTIDHVLEQEVVLADGSVAQFRQLDSAELAGAMQGDTLEAECYRTVYRLGYEHAEEVDRRFPKVLRRVGGYNLDEFTTPGRPFNLAKMMVGSEGTLGVVLEAKLNLVPLPKAKAVLVVQFRELLEALAATPLILTHKPSACEVMDKFILDHTYLSPNLQRVRETFIEGSPGAILCIEFYGDTTAELARRLKACEEDLTRNGYGYRFFHALEMA